MQSYQLAKRYLFKTASVVVIAAMSATSASAVKFPSKKNRYLTKSLEVCDQGLFFVGGVRFKIDCLRCGSDAWPGNVDHHRRHVRGFPNFHEVQGLAPHHGARAGDLGTAVQGTAHGGESWADYTVRKGVPTYVVDQSGRGRSGFDKSVFHEGEYLIDSDPAAAKALIPTLGGSTSNAWNSWFGHIIPETPTPTDITTGQMVRHGAPGDPLCATEPTHCKTTGSISMEGYGIDNAIASRTGRGAPAGSGTVAPDRSGHVNPDFQLNRSVSSSGSL